MPASPSSATPIKAPAPLAPADSFPLISGGKLKMMRTLLENASVQTVSKTAGQVDFSLYDYREQLAAGGLDMRADGNIVVQLGKASGSAGSR